MAFSSYFKREDGARNSLSLKLIVIGVLLLIFIIPVTMVTGLIRERQNRQQNVAGEVGSTWGGPQTLAGPILVVPYNPLTSDGKRKEEEIKYAYFLPNKLNVSGKVEVEIRSRGIYDVPVYTSALSAKGQFSAPDIKLLSLKPEQMRWDKAQLVLGLPDLRGVREQITLRWGGLLTSLAAETFLKGDATAGREAVFSPGVTAAVVPAGVSAPVELQIEGGGARQDITYPFTITLNTRGSEQLFFVPVGKETNVSLAGNWPDPSFTGAFLPEERAVSADGFSAVWKVLDLNRNFPQQWTSDSPIQLGFASGFQPSLEPIPPFPFAERVKPTLAPDSSAFGVRLFIPVDVYQKTLRSARYGIAVIALVFVVIFFVELSAARRVHPVQYVLIGLALVIYYTLLLSLAEQVRFVWAYLIASVATIGLITLFVKSVMQNFGRALLTGAILTLFYGFVFVLLQLEDYALLLGSIALFLILAVIMFLSRRVNWYASNA